MKLKTLIDYQRCFNLLRQFEADGKRISGDDYVSCLSAKAVFDFEMDIAMRGNEVAVTETDWSAA